jgi:primosomal protein N' (replication factor Y)
VTAEHGALFPEPEGVEPEREAKRTGRGRADGVGKAAGKKSTPRAPVVARDGYVRVALKLPLHVEFSYGVPDGMELQVGSRVRVPFRGRDLPGVVVARSETPDDGLDPARVLDVRSVLDPGVSLPPTVVALARRIADDYACSLGEALDATLPAAAKAKGRKLVPHLELAIPRDTAVRAVDELEETSQPRSRVLRTVLEYGAPMPVRDVMRQTATSESPWKTLVRHGTLRRVLLEERGEALEPDASEAAKRHDLNADQEQAVRAVEKVVASGEHRVFLLHGVTGSGKTEVYLRILESVRAQGRTAIVLVPEISLTPQTVGRFASRFPDVAVLHSGLTDAERGRQWQRLARGEAQVVVGARSALFAPLRDVGLIVVDEEHESSFKQESTPRYHAREMAVVRGELENAAVVLGSATPSLESYGRAKRDAYELLTLPARAGAGRLPKIVVEDLRKAGKGEVIDGVVMSRLLVTQMQERLRCRTRCCCS